MATLSLGHPTTRDLHRRPASTDFAAIGSDDADGPNTTRCTPADSAPPWCTPAGQRHGGDGDSDAHSQAKRDGGHSTSYSLTARDRRAPRDSHPCWQLHCHAAISPVRGAVKFPVSPLYLAGSVLPPLPKGPRMPRPSRPTRTTPSPLRQRTQHAGRSRSLGDRVVATISPTLALGPGEAAWLPLGETWPRRRLVDLDDPDAWNPQLVGSVA